MKIAKEVRAGNIIKKGDELFLVLKAEFHKSTSGRRASTAEMKFKVESLDSKNRTMISVDATKKVDTVILDKREAQYMYKDSSYYFMDQTTFEQFSMSEDEIGDATKYLVEEAIHEVLFYKNSPITISLPRTMIMEISYTEPAIRGDTTGKATKPATLKSDLVIQVPLFCQIGDKIVVDTDSDKYIERA